jgi:hypothetical protein
MYFIFFKEGRELEVILFDCHSVWLSNSLCSVFVLSASLHAYGCEVLSAFLLCAPLSTSSFRNEVVYPNSFEMLLGFSILSSFSPQPILTHRDDLWSSEGLMSNGDEPLAMVT